MCEEEEKNLRQTNCHRNRRLLKVEISSSRWQRDHNRQIYQHQHGFVMSLVACVKNLHIFLKNWNFSFSHYSRSKMESPYFSLSVNTCENTIVGGTMTKRQTRSSSKKPIKPDQKEIQINQSMAKVVKTQRVKTKKNTELIVAEVLKAVEVKTEASSSHEKWMPENWEEVLNNIREMRKNRDAPVDNMGCEQCPETSCTPEVSQQVSSTILKALLLLSSRYGASRYLSHLCFLVRLEIR